MACLSGILHWNVNFPDTASLERGYAICRQTNGIRNRVGGYGVEAPLLIKHGFAGKPKCGRTNLRSGLSALLHAFFGKGKTKGIAVRFEKTVIGGGDFVGEGERNDPSAVHILEIPLCGCGLTAFSCAKKGCSSLPDRASLHPIVRLLPCGCGRG